MLENDAGKTDMLKVVIYDKGQRRRRKITIKDITKTNKKKTSFSQTVTSGHSSGSGKIVHEFRL